MDPYSAIAMLVISFIITAFFTPKPKIENARPAELSKIKFPQASASDPLPLLLGTSRITGPNTLWFGDYTAKAVSKKVSTGLFSSSNQITGYDYFLGIQLGLCLGDNVRLISIKAGKDDIWRTNYSNHEPTNNQVVINLPWLFGGPSKNGGLTGTITFFDGSFNQPQCTYLVNKTRGQPVATSYTTTTGDPTSGSGQTSVTVGTTVDPGTGESTTTTTTVINKGGVQTVTTEITNSADAPLTLVPAYNGICYCTFEHFYWGRTAALPQLVFELQRFTNNLNLPNGSNIAVNGVDLNTMEVIYTILTTYWGCLGMPISDVHLPSFLAAAETVYREGQGSSVVVDTPNTAKNLVEELLRQVNGLLYQDPTTGKIAVKLIREDYAIEQLPILNEDIVIEVKDFTTQTWSQTFNQVRVKHPSRLNSYNEEIAIDQDGANINIQRRLLSTEISMPTCYDDNMALAIATRLKTVLAVPLYKISLRCNRFASFITPGSVFVFSFPEFGVFQQVFRAHKVELGTLDDGTVHIDAVQDIFSVNQSVIAPSVAYNERPLDRRPRAIATLHVGEVPYVLNAVAASQGTTPLLQTGQGLVYAYAKSASKFSTGFAALQTVGFFNENNDGSIELDRVFYNNTAVLSAAYNLVTDNYLDTTDGLFVIATLNTTNFKQDCSDADLRLGANLLLVGDEYINFKNFATASNGSLHLTNIRRGLIDTVPSQLPIGTRVWVVDPTYVFADPVPALGLVSVKLLDETSVGQSSPSEVSAVQVQMTQRADRPLPPGMVLVNDAPYTGDIVVTPTIKISWTERNNKKASLYWHDDPTDAPAAGQQYKVATSLGTGNFTEQTVSGNTISFPNNQSSDTLNVRITSLLNGLQSNSPVTVTIFLSGNLIKDRTANVLQGRNGETVFWR